MNFSWEKFCKAHGIPYVTAGPNTARGNISIRCPYCGAADQSEHMGLSVDPRSPVWGCFRDNRHRGRDPARLVAKLLSIHIVRAQAIVGMDQTPIDEFDRAVESLSAGASPALPTDCLGDVCWPDQIRPLTDRGWYQDKFLSYLVQRGFPDEMVLDVCRFAELRYALSGDQAWRLVFPVHKQGKLAGWTGRDIRSGARLRYKAMDGMGKDVLLAFGNIDHPGMVVVEGPMDALKFAYAGQDLGFFAVAVMGAAVTQAQAAALQRIVRMKAATYVVLDSDATATGLQLAQDIGAWWAALPPGVKDPGEMGLQEALNYLKSLRI